MNLEPFGCRDVKINYAIGEKIEDMEGVKMAHEVRVKEGLKEKKNGFDGSMPVDG